jgi:superfamily II DNA/RNA helicase
VLITTDIAARGIDSPELKIVINFNIPRVTDAVSRGKVYPIDSITKKSNLIQFVHRVGRVGRYENIGTAISLVTEEEQDILLRNFPDSKFTVASLSN